MVDGAENNWPSYESTNHYEVAGFYSGSEHLIIPECVCINKGVWDGLSDDDKKLVKNAAQESATLQRKLWAERERSQPQEGRGSRRQVQRDRRQGRLPEGHGAGLRQIHRGESDLETLIEKIKATD